MAEGQVDAVGAGYGMGACGDGGYTVVDETGGASPDGYVAVLDADAARSVGSAEGSEEKGGGKAEGDGDDGLGVVLLVFVLVEREACAGFVAVDEAGVGFEVGEATCCGCVGREICEDRGHLWPGLVGDGVDGGIAVAGSVGDPAELAAVGHSDGHGVAAGDDHVAEG